MQSCTPKANHEIRLPAAIDTAPMVALETPHPQPPMIRAVATRNCFAALPLSLTPMLFTSARYNQMRAALHGTWTQYNRQRLYPGPQGRTHRTTDARARRAHTGKHLG